MIAIFSKSKSMAQDAPSRPPPFLIGAALVFWGWQTDLMIWALPMALLIEACHYVSARWEFSKTDLNRVFDLCVVIGLGVGVVLYSSESPLQFFFRWIQLMPFYFLPIVLAQVFGSREQMPLSVFSWVLRRTPNRPIAQKSFNIAWIYFAMCLLGVSAINTDTFFFYFGVLFLIFLALAAVRPTRLTWPYWFALVVLAGTGGYFGHRLMHSGQADLEVAIGNWLANATRRGRIDPREARTAIGQSGRMKLSGKIVYRVQPEPGTTPPQLLREATYDSYHRGGWRTTENQFERVFVDTNDVAVMIPNTKPTSAVHIAGFLDNGRGILALPNGVSELQNYPALLETNRFGVARADGGPGFINYLARYNAGSSYDAPYYDESADLEEPPGRDRPTLEKIVKEMELESKSVDEKLQTIATWFQTNFTYTLEGQRTPQGKSPITQFLTETRAGHCEHFATAAVLLLRTAGVPARYAIGYVVPESGRHGNTWYVRERHGHAWVMVWREDHKRWEEFDPTPASRDAIEESRASALEGISDFTSNIWYQFSKWRWSKTDYMRYAPWFLIPLLALMLWRILSGKRQRQKASAAAHERELNWPGLDSELYLINRHLAEEHQRYPHEPLFDWKTRLTRLQLPSLDRAFELHRRFRFDPHGLSPADRTALKSEVQQWLSELETKKSEVIKRK